jgi:hypothetical protein
MDEYARREPCPHNSWTLWEDGNRAPVAEDLTEKEMRGSVDNKRPARFAVCDGCTKEIVGA